MRGRVDKPYHLGSLKTSEASFSEAKTSIANTFSGCLMHYNAALLFTILCQTKQTAMPFTQYQAQTAAAAQSFQQNHRPYRYFRRHTAAADALLAALWQHHFSGCPQLCLLATGGYGRSELYPHSDLDLAILSPNELTAAEQERIAQFIQTLWDNQLTPAPQSGSLKQIAQAAQDDLTTSTALLEARPLCGNIALAQQAIHTAQQQREIVPFIESKLLEMQQRQAKQPSQTLEPHIKNGIGGLRDLHVINWLARVQNLNLATPSAAANSIITPTETKLLRHSHRTLAQLRIAMHLAAQREEDRLIFDLQHTLAQRNPFSGCHNPIQGSLKAENHTAAIEQLMHTYYRTTKTIQQLSGILIPMLRERIYSPLPRITQQINEHYFQINNKIAANDLNLFTQQPEHIFILAHILQTRPDINHIAPKTLRAWWAAAQKLDSRFNQNPANRAQFLQFFHTGEGLTHTLRLLNLYGILARYLPQWHNIVGLLQHDLYHIYPVDDHILTTLAHLRRLAQEEHSHENPALSTLMQHHPKQPILYLAALFHDIAKGRGGDHAQLGAQDAAQFAQAHQLNPHDSDLLTWLVREHLLMSQTAQKEDISDPTIIQKFAQRVQSQEKLDSLYLLTVCDIRATNPKIWNTWKAQLLDQLYHSTRAQLSGSLKTTSIHDRYQHANQILTQQNHSPKAIRSLFNALGAAYFARHNSPTITRQLPQIAAQPHQPHASVTPENNGNWRILVYMPNQDRLFTRLCRLFGQHQLDIVAARAFITAHDFILDNFILTPPPHHSPQAAHILQTELDQFVHGNIPPLPQHKTQPSRRARLLPLAPSVSIQPEEAPHRYTIQIIAANRPHLLADITEVFAQHNIRLFYAKIATLADRAEDSFLIENTELANPSKEFALKRDLLAAMA